MGDNKTHVGIHNGMPALGIEELVNANIDCRELMKDLPVAIYMCNTEGRILFYNAEAAKLWGRTPDPEKDSWTGAYKIFKSDGSDLAIPDCPLARSVREGNPVSGEEIIYEQPDGLRLNILPHPKLVFDQSGKLTVAVNVLLNITDEKKRENDLIESESKYKLLSESLEKLVEVRTEQYKLSEERHHKMIEEVQDYAILLMDKDGTIVNWNKGAEKIKGYSASEIVGKNFRLFYREEDRMNKVPERLINEAIETGRAMQEGWRVRKDKTRFWGSIVITAIHDNQGNVIGFTKVTRDLTEKKLMDDQLRQNAADLEFQNKQLEEYAHVASHDLQEPLRKIQTFAEQLKTHIDDKEAALRNLEKINTSAKKMSGLIKDVLKYSQLTQSELVFVEADLNVILENVKADYDLLMEQRGVKLLHDHLPVIKGIPIQLEQLFSNLIGNAIKFTDVDPVIEVRYSKAKISEIKNFQELNPDNDYVKLSFTDNGIGFEQEYSDRIFKLFQRLNGTKYGSGIGLALCKRIVENHKGAISVTSVPGKGSSFVIFLPLL